MKFFIKVVKFAFQEVKSFFIFLFRINSIFHLKKLNNILEKKFISSPNKRGNIIIDGMWDNPFHWVRMIILTNGLKHKHGLNYVGLIQDTTPKKTKLMFNIFNLRKIITLKSDLELKYIRQARKIIKKFKNVNELCNGRIIEDYPGFLFYDGVLKKERLAEIKVTDKKIIYHLATTLKYYFFYKKLIEKENISAFYTSHLVHFRYSTLVWNLIKKKIPVYCSKDKNQHNYIMKITTKNQILKPFDDVPTKNEIDKLIKEKRKKIIKIANKYISDLFKGKKGESQFFQVFKNSNEKISKIKFNKMIGADNKKKNIVIMANSWVDFPHEYGNTWYADLAEWIRFIYNYSKKKKRYNWIFKPHPAENWHGSKTNLKEILGKKLHNNAYYWPINISATQMLNCSDYMITARGTSAVEYASKGHKVLVSTPSPYTNLNFLTYAKNRKDFLHKLNKIEKIKKISKKQLQYNKIYITCKEADFKNKNFLEYPLNIFSEKNYIKISKFITNNFQNILEEANQIKIWGNKKHNRFRTYQVLNYL